jgi:hypothetical protein
LCLNRRVRKLHISAFALGIGAALALGACGSSDSSSGPSGDLTRGVLTVTGKAQPERGPSAALLTSVAQKLAVDQ